MRGGRPAPPALDPLMISFYYYNNTGWEGGLIFQNQKLGWEGGRNPIIFQNTKFPKNTTVTTTDFFPTFFPKKNQAGRAGKIR